MEVASEVISCILINPRFHYVPRNKPLIIHRSKKNCPSRSVTQLWLAIQRCSLRSNFKVGEKNKSRLFYVAIWIHNYLYCWNYMYPITCLKLLFSCYFDVIHTYIHTLITLLASVELKNIVVQLLSSPSFVGPFYNHPVGRLPLIQNRPFKRPLSTQDDTNIEESHTSVLQMGYEMIIRIFKTAEGNTRPRLRGHFDSLMCCSWTTFCV